MGPAFTHEQISQALAQRLLEIRRRLHGAHRREAEAAARELAGKLFEKARL